MVTLSHGYGSRVVGNAKSINFLFWLRVMGLAFSAEPHALSRDSMLNLIQCCAGFLKFKAFAKSSVHSINYPFFGFLGTFSENCFMHRTVAETMN